MGGLAGRGSLVIFTDSSNLAQAAAGYWVTEENGKIDDNLLAAKTKITGMRQHEHIGRLELVAAVLGVQLAVKIAIAFRIPVDKITYFTDSMSVLYWLSTSAALSAYTGHRVSKIMERCKFKQWNYVHTSENPSDLPTRGVRAVDLGNCTLWWKGPEFLRKPRYLWPTQPEIRATEATAAEVRKVEEITRTIVLRVKGEPSVRKNRLALVQTYVDQGFPVRKSLRLVERLGMVMYKKFGNRQMNPTFRELEAVWIASEQQKFFRTLYNELQEGKRVTQLVELDPRLDSWGVIRVTSVHHDLETTFPSLLHAKMRFAQELLDYIHKRALNHMGGVTTLMNLVRNRFHMVGGQKAASKTIQRCFPCAKKNWQPLTRKLPEFHESRLGNKALRVFNEIGIDHAGPFHLKQGRSTVEGYVLVIACCATRAVNLEMSLSTGAEHVLAGFAETYWGLWTP